MNNLLDRAFTHYEPSVVTRIDNPILPVDNYHPALECELPVGKISSIEWERIKLYDFKNANYALLIDELFSINWANLSHLDINVAVSEFYSLIYDLFDKYIPSYYTGVDSRYPC